MITADDARALPLTDLYHLRVTVNEELHRRKAYPIGRPRKEFCVNNHERTVKNINPANGGCRRCQYDQEKLRIAGKRKEPPKPERPPPPPIDHTQCNPPRGNSPGSLCPECRAEWDAIQPELDAYKEVAR